MQLTGCNFDLRCDKPAVALKQPRRYSWRSLDRVQLPAAWVPRKSGPQLALRLS